MVGIAARVLPLLVIGGLIGGVGWGSSYSGTLRMLSPLAEPDQRAGLFAAVFTVAYLAVGVPVIVAGQLIPQAGLSSTTIGYCVAIVVVATTGLIAQSGVARRRTRADAVRPGPDDDNGSRERMVGTSTTRDEFRSRDAPGSWKPPSRTDRPDRMLTAKRLGSSRQCTARAARAARPLPLNRAEDANACW